ncbi:MAG: ABC transporter ATP-binding protein [Firmicutes bacterium]|jgi:ABC-2 type transport system ATP-binding protein|nr:ABC transporter ATP-binding protein [Bacillota bacterium]
MISTNNLCKSFDGFDIRNVSLNIEAGYIYGFVGQNGAGKTSTIKLLMGLTNADFGDIEYFEGISLDDAKKKIGFVYDDCSYYENLSGERMAKIISKFYGDWNWDLFHNYCQRFKLPLNKKIEAYSKGMKVKFSLACAMCHCPDLLVLDEPTSGLDPMFRNELLGIFQEYIENGDKSVFFSTHITSDLEKVADYVYFIDNGAITLEASCDALSENYGLIKGPKEILESNKSEIIGLTHLKYTSKGIVADKENVGHMIENGCLVEPASYEDILIHYIREGQNEATTY